MKEYFIDPASGQLCPNNHENVLTLTLLSQEEFAGCRQPLPHRGGLLRALEQANLRSCRAEGYANCVYGTMALPGEEPDGQALIFGFLLLPQALYLEGGGTRLDTHMERARQLLTPGCHIGDVLLALFNQLLEQDAERLMTLSDELDALEAKLLVSLPRRFYPLLLRYQRRLSRLHTYYEQLVNLGEGLAGTLHAVTGQEEHAAWQRYAGRAERLHDYAETLREHLVQLRELYEAQVSGMQNRTMTLLTVVTTLFMPLTLIAGWYGMNFTAMPELDHPYGYVGVILVSVGIVIAEIIWFKKKRML